MLTTPLDLDPQRIAAATDAIDPVFLDTPQYVDPMLAKALGRPVLVKIETANPLRSFKGRGADLLLHRMAAEGRDADHLVCASTGNFGQAIAYAASRRGKRATVFVPADINPTKRERMSRLGATVIPIDGDGDDAGDEARAFAERRPGLHFVEDGHEPSVAEGAGTIGVELLREPIDTIVVPVGDGALITGIGTWARVHTPSPRIIGVCATGASSMADSWRAGRPIPTPSADTIAEGIAVRDPIAASVARMLAVVDDMVLVDDADMIEASGLIERCLGIVPEPAGAAGLAALTVHDLPGERIATVLTGANPRA
jgi:threonine dehydratase